ncbi:hypothetical protein [uncultured Ruminococcus sp.]|uniref:hypothetical protein n=1 Tax=uncultured Ruminococcus sp. TaxID=165186 RepID=UPI00292FDD6F|nr:hypothetical protein [uncultured Ruminococcus sp.]
MDEQHLVRRMKTGDRSAFDSIYEKYHIPILRSAYLICGDNRVGVESGITDRHIIGVLTEIIRDGETISVYSPKKRLYAHVYSDFMPIKRVIFRLKHVFKKR